MQSVTVIGIGRLGGALALALSRAGYRVNSLVYRSDAPLEIAMRIDPAPVLKVFTDVGEIESDLIFITAQDPEIGSIASRLASNVKGDPFIFHTSGALSSEVLSTLADHGTGSLHPLVSISDPVRGSERFAGAYFCVEGRSDAVAAAVAIVEKLGGKHFSIDTHFKALYHASAVTASGHVVALIDMAVEMLSKCGVEPRKAKLILMPLVKSTIENLEHQNIENALTGTFARADVDAVRRHANALINAAEPEVRDIYLLLGERSVELAKHAGRTDEELAAIRKGILLALDTRK